MSTSWCCAVSLGSDYGAWCRVTVCRLSCTATLILSINNNPAHCRPEPHLLITICHLSDAPPSPSPSALALPSSRAACTLPAGPVTACTSPPPTSLPPPPLAPAPVRLQLRDMVRHTEGRSRSPLPLAHFNCTLEGVWLIKGSPALIGQITVNNLGGADCFGDDLPKITGNYARTNLGARILVSLCRLCNTYKPCTVWCIITSMSNLSRR